VATLPLDLAATQPKWLPNPANGCQICSQNSQRRRRSARVSDQSLDSLLYPLSYGGQGAG